MFQELTKDTAATLARIVASIENTSSETSRQTSTSLFQFTNFDESNREGFGLAGVGSTDAGMKNRTASSLSSSTRGQLQALLLLHSGYNDHNMMMSSSSSSSAGVGNSGSTSYNNPLISGLANDDLLFGDETIIFRPNREFGSNSVKQARGSEEDEDEDEI
jgi:hypothetical protein